MVAPREQQGALIPQFYAGRSVLITGATGFVGKVLVERLLFTCPDIGRLVLLLRAKKGTAPQQRLKELKESQVFDVVRQRCPQQLDKLVALEGDVAVEGLGLPPGAAQQLQDISVVFHSAATLKFDEELRKAVDQNVRSVMRLMELCDTLPDMQAFVHVSTAYSNAELSTVAERVYPAPAPLPAVLALTSHALAESAVERHGNTGYPIAIFRPTIALRHPFPGWIENLNGPTGVVVAIGKGLLHVFRCAGTKADFLPVDIAADTLIAVAWETAVDNTAENPTTFKAFEEEMRRAVTHHPFDKALWWLYWSMEFLLQKAPLFLAEHCARLLGIKTQLVHLHRLSAMNGALEFFSTREWQFETGRVRALRRRLSPADQRTYNLDSRYARAFVYGTLRLLLSLFSAVYGRLRA
ncbi:hypothetical protein MSG28_015270 [Choristoneura fumiferana]|uniref:Uncharacterized protein n=1 Tax=Choristoneura fumiferana TaxID=7141 RepID=A0ACC0KA95_CHOFU|nr:hypothetical protein MSG28_015270 [Choristoneura fumiferana]